MCSQAQTNPTSLFNSETLAPPVAAFSFHSPSLLLTTSSSPAPPSIPVTSVPSTPSRPSPSSSSHAELSNSPFNGFLRPHSPSSVSRRSRPLPRTTPALAYQTRPCHERRRPSMAPDSRNPDTAWRHLTSPRRSLLSHLSALKIDQRGRTRPPNILSIWFSPQGSRERSVRVNLIAKQWEPTKVKPQAVKTQES